MGSRSKPTTTTHVDGVLVVGAGYAGLHALRAAEQAGVVATLLDPSDHHDFVTRLAAVAGGSAAARDASHQLTAFADRIIAGTAAGLGDGIVTLDDDTRLTADAVVFCAGAAPTTPGIEGFEHAMPLRTSDDALRIREALESSDAITIVGGGATGVQLAGAIAATGAADAVTLIDAESRLLSTMSEASSAGAARILGDRGVEILTDTTVDRITASGVEVGGSVLPGVVVWAGGFAPRTAGLEVELTDDGAIVVDAALRVAGMARTFAAGDVAAHLDDTGERLPMSAQVAVQAGTGAGSNAARIANGHDAEPVSLAHRGWVLDLSGHRGIAEFGNVSLATPFADLTPPLLHGLLDLKTLFGIGGISALKL